MTPPKGTRPAASVLCVGTGDGWPCADRGHSSYLFSLGAARVLIDCGDGTCRTLTRLKFDWDTLDAIVISHGHADHVAGLFMVLQGMWLDGRKRRRALAIHLPEDLIEPVRSMLNQLHLFPELFPFKLRFTPLNDGKRFQIRGVRITARLNTHLESKRQRFQKIHPQRFESFSFVLESGDKRIVHSADLGSPEDLVPLLRRPADLLICEMAHFTSRALTAVLRPHAIEQLALIHVGRVFRRRLAGLKKEFQRGLPGVTCVIPNDGDRVRVGG